MEADAEAALMDEVKVEDCLRKCPPFVHIHQGIGENHGANLVVNFAIPLDPADARVSRIIGVNYADNLVLNFATPSVESPEEVRRVERDAGELRHKKISKIETSNKKKIIR